MKFKSLILLLGLSLLTSNPIYAAVDRIEDTFTYKNAQNLYTSIPTAEYMITADNGIMGRGSAVYGVTFDKVTNTNGEWKPIIKNTKGDILYGVVDINLSKDGFLNIIDIDGNLYQLGGSYYAPKHISNSANGKVVDYAYHKQYWNGVKTQMKNVIYQDKILIDGVGNTGYRDANYNKQYDISDIKQAKSVGYHISINELCTYSLILKNNGELDMIKMNNAGGFILEQSVDSSVKIIKDLSPGWNGAGNTRVIAILYENGSVVQYDVVSKASQSYVFMKDGKDISDQIVVQNILNSETVDTTLIVDTNKGVFKGSRTDRVLIFEESLTSLSPVHITAEGLLSKTGAFYKATTPYAFEGSNKEEFQWWQNVNPIVPEEMLANVEVEKGALYDRDKQFKITYNLVSTKDPIAFNIYYCKDDKAQDQSNWIKIEDHINSNQLGAETYDTGLSFSTGDAVLGTKYTYTWEPEGELTHIRFIIEPIYN